MELPTYQLPSFRNLIINTWNKLKAFVLGAGKIIVLVVMIINVVNSIGVPHDIKGDINTVVTRSLCVSSVRAAIMPGTLQPKPTISGINALPDNPILRKNARLKAMILAIF
jgi:Fe2+ transport system protein B